MNSSIVPVAAAVLLAPDGRFLLAQRPPGRAYAGWWEFPGGKIEPGERPEQALVRELAEELGICVQQAYPWLTRVFTYAHATVRLHFYRVTAWVGEPTPREGQTLAWARAEDCGVAPLLPANGPILRALSLPAVMGLSNVAELGVADFLVRLETALASGLRLIQLREKDLTPAQFALLARQVVASVHRHGARLIINADPATAAKLEADGVHLNSAQLMALRQRPDLPWCGASCHSREELDHAARLGLDYVVLGPVLPTLSHPNATTLGWEGFAELVRDYPLPVYAIGGMRPEHLERAWQHGAHGIAMLRRAW
ncbi:Nudix family hydrolase [Thiobacter aerophilum]|uniref:8-oxo-dGTP diphosphatase n=1 Tax=Thiobacter aerophilum TaxID=3121275 RepID=A0ABV0EIJ4_9BURK